MAERANGQSTVVQTARPASGTPSTQTKPAAPTTPSTADGGPDSPATWSTNASSTSSQPTSQPSTPKTEKKSDFTPPPIVDETGKVHGFSPGDLKPTPTEKSVAATDRGFELHLETNPPQLVGPDGKVIAEWLSAYGSWCYPGSSNPLVNDWHSWNPHKQWNQSGIKPPSVNTSEIFKPDEAPFDPDAVM